MAGIYQSIQGNIGLGKAIEYFTSHGITVALPLNDTQKYDLIADFNNGLQRVSVKTSRNSRTEGRTQEVLLKNCGGTGRGQVRLFDNKAIDYLFIYTAANDIYLIPTNQIEATNGIVVGNKYSEYKVQCKTLKDYDEEIRLKEK